MASRRAFLRTSALGAVGLGTAEVFRSAARDRAVAAQEDQSGEPARFRYGVSTIMYYDSPLEVALEEIARTGCEGVDLWEAPADMPTNHMQWVWKNRPDRLREFVESFGLKLWSFSIYWTPGNEHLERLAWLQEAGGQVAVVGGGAAVGQPVQAGLDALRPLVARAEELGLRVAGENHGGSSLSTIASLREYVSLAASPALGLALAPYHVMGEGESVPEAIEAAGDKLFFLYAWQRAPGLQELPGDGTLDFAPVLDALRRVRYNGYVSIFTHTHVPRTEMTQGVVAARQYLERLAQGLGGQS